MFFDFKNKQSGKKFKTFIVAEIGQSHNGSLKYAKNLIDHSAKAGADAVKFQTHYAFEESSNQDKFRKKNIKFKSRYNYWKRMEFTESQWREISNYAKKKKLVFLSSPFSIKALNTLLKLNIPAIKIASGEVNNRFLINEIIKARKPIILSCGMSSSKEIDQLVKFFKKKKIKICLLHCSSSYPNPLKNIGIGMLNYYKKKYKISVGLSDHSGNYLTGLSAISLGADLLEVHVVKSKKNLGFDTSSSITFKELKILSEFRNFYEKYYNLKINKKIDKKIKNMRKLFFRSLAFKKNMRKGDKILFRDLTLKKPGTGINFNEMKKIIGKTLIKDKNAKDLINWSDFE